MTERQKAISLDESLPLIDEIAQEFGLGHCPTAFTKVPARLMYEYGSYGLPVRFSHWTFGRDFDRQKTMYDYGVSKIYELVVNTDPAQAFFLETNSDIANKVVAAHVLGHVDFFQHNRYFGHTNRTMAVSAGQNAERLREYEYEYGEGLVEQVLDSALSLEMNFDQDPRGFNRLSKDEYIAKCREEAEMRLKVRDVASSEYDDLFEMSTGRRERSITKPKLLVPYEDDPDLLWTVATFSPILPDWQRDVLHMIRSEQQHFLPQMQTKIMNEGWASFWHTRIIRLMYDRGLLTEGEFTDYQVMHAGVIAASKRGINPYLVGLRGWEDIDDKFHGKYNPGNFVERDRFGDRIDPKSYVGMDEYNVFNVREVMADQGFLRSYLTPRLVDDLDLYKYEKRGNDWVVVDKDFETIRNALVDSLTNLGRPVIKVKKGGTDYTGKGELRIKHEFDGKPLDTDWAAKTLKHLYYLWGRPVYLETFERSGKSLFLSATEGKTAADDK